MLQQQDLSLSIDLLDLSQIKLEMEVLRKPSLPKSLVTQRWHHSTLLVCSEHLIVQVCLRTIVSDGSLWSIVGKAGLFRFLISKC